MSCAAVGNQSGVLLTGRGNLVRGNVISGNLHEGVVLDGQEAGDGRGGENVLHGNSIGLGADGTTPLGNGGHGVLVWQGASRNLIGANGDGVADDTEGNVIAYNGLDGVAVIGDVTLGNTIRRNSIFANGNLGIDLADDGITPNDKGDKTATPIIPPDTDLNSLA